MTPITYTIPEAAKMEHPYYKIDEVSQMYGISKSQIIRYAISGRLNIYILTAKFKIFWVPHKIKHNLTYESFRDLDEYDAYLDYVKGEIVKYEEHILLEDAVVDEGEYIQLSKKCLSRYEAGDLDAKVSIDYAVANDDHLVHYYVLSLKNENWEISALQDCELIILTNDLSDFQDLVFRKNNITTDGEDVSKDDLDITTEAVDVLKDDLDITTEAVDISKDDLDITTDGEDFQLLQLNPATDLSGDIAVIQTRKKLIPLQRATNDGLMLIHRMCAYYNVKYLDQLQALTAWGKIVTNEYQDDLIVSVDKNNIYLKTMKMDRGDFLEKYRKRFR